MIERHKAKLPPNKKYCDNCNGYGEVRYHFSNPPSRDDYTDCRNCEGKGYIDLPPNIYLVYQNGIMILCSKCGISGKSGQHNPPCQIGNKTLPWKKEFEDKGMQIVSTYIEG